MSNTFLAGSNTMLVVPSAISLTPSHPSLCVLRLWSWYRCRYTGILRVLNRDPDTCLCRVDRALDFAVEVMYGFALTAFINARGLPLLATHYHSKNSFSNLAAKRPNPTPKPTTSKAPKTAPKLPALALARTILWHFEQYKVLPGMPLPRKKPQAAQSTGSSLLGRVMIPLSCWVWALLVRNGWPYVTALP